MSTIILFKNWDYQWVVSNFNKTTAELKQLNNLFDCYEVSDDKKDFLITNIGVFEELKQITNEAEAISKLDNYITDYSNSQQKQTDIQDFVEAYNEVENIRNKIKECEANKLIEWCTQDNKDLIDMQITDFNTRLATAITIRDNKLSAGITNHTDGSTAQKQALMEEFNTALLWSTSNT